MFTAIVFGLLIAACVKWIWDRKKLHNIFKEMGVPGPKPEFLFGNFTTIKQKGLYETLDSWLQEYGKTFGYFEGAMPVLVTTDLEVAKQVLIKDFNSFHARQNTVGPGQNKSSKYQNVLFSEGETWRRLRSISSPTFSASKMKEMSPLVNNCIDNFLTLLEGHCDGKSFNIYAEYQRLTLDTIANCAFGIESSCVLDEDSTFMQRGRNAFEMGSNPPFFLKMSFLLRLLCPTLQSILHQVVSHFRPVDTENYFHSLARSVILQRQNDKSANRVDFVQLMINARETSLKAEQMEVNVDKDDDVAETKKAPAQAKGMTLEEMEDQSLVFLLAGFETTSTSLAFVSYQLALHPDIQDKLRKEVDEHFPDGKRCRPDYVSIQKLQYMDMVLKEVLRIHTPASRAVNRDCKEACTVKGIRIPKGVNVHVYNHGVHMDPDYWGPEDPREFVPERFSPERKGDVDPLAWMPFGAGPRNCVGMRFGLMEVKIAMARILKHYEIHRCPETKVPLPVSKVSFRSPSEGIYVTLSKRRQ